jgi:hypothetical protein
MGTEKSPANANAPARIALQLSAACQIAAELPETTAPGFPWKSATTEFTNPTPIKWGDEHSSIVLFYGTVGDDPKTYRKDRVPLYEKPYITVSESTRAWPFPSGAGSYIPPEGSLFISAASGYLQRDGLQISVDAGSETAILRAAQALTPMTP